MTTAELQKIDTSKLAIKKQSRLFSDQELGDLVIAAGDKAAGPVKIKAKWLSRPVKKRKPSKPLDWRELAKAAAAAPKDDAPPTRQELELKARELDIRFDGRTPDRKLGQLIQHRITGV